MSLGFGTAWAVDFYVDPVADLDTLTCTDPLAPCQSIACTIAQSIASDTVNLGSDRDACKKLSQGKFRGHLDQEGVKSFRCPARAPNSNSYAEQFVRSIQWEKAT